MSKEAEKHIVEALKLAKKARDLGIILVILAAYAKLLSKQGELARAVQLASLVQGHPVTWHETRSQAATLLADLKKSLSRKEFGNAEKGVQAADAWRLASELASRQ